MPDASDGIGFIRAVRAGWPDLPLAAITGYPRDLDILTGLSECPSLIVPKPFRAHQVAEVLRLALQVPYWMLARGAPASIVRRGTDRQRGDGPPG